MCRIPGLLTFISSGIWVTSIIMVLPMVFYILLVTFHFQNIVLCPIHQGSSFPHTGREYPKRPAGRRGGRGWSLHETVPCVPQFICHKRQLRTLRYMSVKLWRWPAEKNCLLLLSLEEENKDKRYKFKTHRMKCFLRQCLTHYGNM